MARQVARGKGNIQAGRDVILNIISSVHAPEDVDQAISAFHSHLDRLQRRRGWIDARLLLALAFGASTIAGLMI